MHHAREPLQESEEHLEEVHSAVSVGRIELDEDALHLREIGRHLWGGQGAVMSVCMQWQGSLWDHLHSREIGRHLSCLRQAIKGALAHLQLHSYERRLAGIPDEGGNQRSSVAKHSGAAAWMHAYSSSPRSMVRMYDVFSRSNSSHLR